jgi:hypothetical protein
MRRLLLGAVTVVGCLLATVAPARADVPVNVTPPHIDSNPPNTAEYRQQLVDQGGTWTATVTPYVIRMQWQDCDAGGQACVPIAGATGRYYTLQAADVGHTIRVAETAVTATESTSPAVSAQTVVVGSGLPVNVNPPAVFSNPPNTAVVTQELGARGSVWTGTYVPATISWQWLRCDAHGQACTPIPGATANVYTLQPSDLGHTIRVEAYAVNAAATGPPAVSDPTIVVTKLHTDAGDTVQPPFSELANDPLRPARAQSSVAYLLQHNGYSAPVQATVRGRLEVTWTTRRKHKTVTLASGQKSLRPGHHAFRVHLTHKGSSILRRSRRLKFSVNAWYITRNPSNLQWQTCRYRGSVKPNRQLAIGKTCSEFLAGPPRLRL